MANGREKRFSYLRISPLLSPLSPLLSPLSLLPSLSLLPCLFAWLLAGAARGEGPAAAAVYRGKSASQWAGELGAKDFSVRWYATYALGRMGPGAAPAVPALRRVLANLGEEEYVRGGAAWALGRIGPKATVAVPLLTRTLGSKLVSVRRNAAMALGNLLPSPAPGKGQRPKPPSPVSGEGQGVRVRGLQGGDSSPVIAGLLKLLRDEDISVRVSASVALWRIQRHPKAILILETMLRDRDGSTAYQAAAALGDLEAAAEPAVPALIAALLHPDGDTRRTAAYALGRIGPAAIPALRTALANRDEKLKCQAVEALGWIGPPAIAPLIDALGDRSPPVRRGAARCLGRLGPAARRAEPALVKAVRDTSAEVRDAAATALRQIRGTRRLSESARFRSRRRCACGAEHRGTGPIEGARVVAVGAARRQTVLTFLYRRPPNGCIASVRHAQPLAAAPSPIAGDPLPCILRERSAP